MRYGTLCPNFCGHILYSAVRFQYKIKNENVADPITGTVPSFRMGNPAALTSYHTVQLHYECRHTINSFSEPSALIGNLWAVSGCECAEYTGLRRLGIRIWTPKLAYLARAKFYEAGLVWWSQIVNFYIEINFHKITGIYILHFLFPAPPGEQCCGTGRLLSGSDLQ